MKKSETTIKAAKTDIISDVKLINEITTYNLNYINSDEKLKIDIMNKINEASNNGKYYCDFLFKANSFKRAKNIMKIFADKGYDIKVLGSNKESQEARYGISWR